MKQWPSGRRSSRTAPRGPNAGPPGGRLWGCGVAQGAAGQGYPYSCRRGEAHDPDNILSSAVMLWRKENEESE